MRGEEEGGGGWLGGSELAENNSKLRWVVNVGRVTGVGWLIESGE